MAKFLKNLVVACLIFQIFSINNVFVLAVASSTVVSLTVEAGAVVCDSDGVCETGENSTNCAADCGCNNNGSCQTSRGETEANCPADCQVVSAGGGGPTDTQSPVIYDIKAEQQSLQAVLVSWKTTEQSFCNLFIGKTIDYELYNISGFSWVMEHSNFLSELLVDTTYHYKIICRDYAGNQSIKEELSFIILPLKDEEPPANVSNFEAIGADKAVDIFWQNPKDEDFEGILITRSPDFYPRKPTEGEVIFQGKLENIKDLNVINDQDYFYTAFTYDKNNNFSSGAIASARPQGPEKPITPSKPPIKPPIGPAPFEVEKIKLSDFDFIQQGMKLNILPNAEIDLQSQLPLIASIDYQKVPEVLKTIMISLQKDNKFFSFLLKINKEKTKYTATLSGLEPGQYPMEIYVLDYQNQALKKIQGSLLVEGASWIMPKGAGDWLAKFLKDKNLQLFFLVLLAIILDVASLWLYWRKKQK